MLSPDIFLRFGFPDADLRSFQGLDRFTGSGRFGFLKDWIGFSGSFGFSCDIGNPFDDSKMHPGFLH